MSKTPKIRADEALVKQGLAQSRSRAGALIMAGKVLMGDKLVKKAGQLVAEGKTLTLKEKDHPWVSRGGIKLAHALEHFRLDLKERVILDIGASTGGFTDVALQAGASRVYAVDVGKGQLDWNLRQNDRVVVMEKTNARYLGKGDLPEAVDVIVCDASFISLKTLLPKPMEILKPGGFLVALIKPQFEAGKDRIGKGGVVRDDAVRREICQDIHTWFESRKGWEVLGIEKSPITGPKGNVEFLIAVERHDQS